MVESCLCCRPAGGPQNFVVPRPVYLSQRDRRSRRAHVRQDKGLKSNGIALLSSLLMLEYRGRMRFRSAWTGLLLMVVMAVACFGPVCGVACAAKAPCHDASSMTDCTGMGPMASVHAAASHATVCAQDDAVVDRSDVDVHQLAVVAVMASAIRVDAVHPVAAAAVRGLAKAPPRPVVVMRV